MNKQQFNGVLRRACEVAPWSSSDKDWFVDMNRRLISPPETNYMHWDYIEKQEIEYFLSRCKQLEECKFMPPDFKVNWKNLITALDFCDELRSRWEPIPMPPTYQKRSFPDGVTPYYDPRQNEERSLKRAVREGKVFDPWGSKIGDKGILKTLKFCIKDLDSCIELQDESKTPVKMTVKEYMDHRKQEHTLFAHHLQKFNKTERLELNP